ncbi:MAG: SDR family NAD(P)-dependent oxidoreductase [Bacillota bacterium]|nr:SDR family NAD(P)-dependent oxidoreductase [Bacillota bacterium]
MDRKTILITGASSGIGRETAISLAKQGHSIIIHGRNPEKTKAVYEEIENIGGKVAMYTTDLSLISEVKRLADEIKSKYDRLDVLINNAGGQFGNKREVTAEGHEKTFAINTLAPFLLTKLLMELLVKSDSSRVVTVSSESYRQGGQPIWADIELEHHYSLTRSYGLSKLYVYWVMRQFAVELNKAGITNVTVNTVEPGSANTNLGRVSASKGFGRIIYFLWKPMMWSIEKAAATSIYLATSPEVEGVTGEFYGNCKRKDIKYKWISEEGQQRIWDYCFDACKQYLRQEI